MHTDPHVHVALVTGKAAVGGNNVGTNKRETFSESETSVDSERDWRL